MEAFLSENPTEIVTIIIEDYVHTPKGLTNLFASAGLDKYWFPVSKMPKKGEDWPTVTEMAQQNHRLLVFTSDSTKEAKEGIAYQWKYMVENERKYYMQTLRRNLYDLYCQKWMACMVLNFSWRPWGGSRLMPKQETIEAVELGKHVPVSAKLFPHISGRSWCLQREFSSATVDGWHLL